MRQLCFDTVDLETFFGRKLITWFCDSDYDSVLGVGWGVVIQYKLNSGRDWEIWNNQQQYCCHNFAKYMSMC